MTKATITIEIDTSPDAFFSESDLQIVKEGVVRCMKDMMFYEKEFQVNVEEAV